MMTADEFVAEWENESEKVLVHTSGSTGETKPLWVEKRRMRASAEATCRHLSLKAGDRALLCLPTDYIAGKMMVVRALVCGLRLTCVEPSGHPLSEVGEEGFEFAAMVPMQVYNTLQVPEERERLTRIHHLIIGGGAIDETLESSLAGMPNAIWGTYGMTETLSHIALRRVNGKDASQWFTPMEGVTVGLSSEGCLVINAPAVSEGIVETNDIAEMASDGLRFRIVGRRDNVICSGGLKIQIEEVERILKPHLPFAFMITKRRDARLGEAVVMLIEGDETESMLEIAESVCGRQLEKFMRPREYLFVAALPMTETGKAARKRAEEMVRGVARGLKYRKGS